MKSPDLDVLPMVMGGIAGLVLFLYGVSRLGEGLKGVAGDNVQQWLSRFTRNRVTGVLTGTAATTLLDSSSVTIILVISLVNVGLLTFTQSLGVVLGSNIGTTISSQLIAFQVGRFAPIAMLAGFLLHLLAKSDRWKSIGQIVLSIGLIFFGLDYIGEAMEPFRQHQPFLDFMGRLGDQPWLGALVGAGFTVLVQSSSATLGIVITLASGNLIPLPTAVALMLGAEIGTCADTLLATIGRNREAVRTGFFHLGFNLTTATLGLLFVGQLTALATWLAFGAGVPRQIANAHLLFNLLGVLLFLPFLSLIARGLERLLPGQSES